MPRAAKTTAAAAAPVPTDRPRILRVSQGTPEWHGERAARIGGSDANVIEGASPYLTPFQLWQIKTGKRERPEGYALREGQRLEPIIMERYMARTGRIVSPVVMVAGNDWQISSLDGMTLDQDRVVEAKNIDRESFELAKAGQVAPKYWPQVQHNLGVTRAPVLDFVAYNEAADDLAIVEVTLDTPYFFELTEHERAFLESVITQVPPALVDRDVVLRDDELWRDTAAAWEIAKQRLEEAEATLERRKADVIRLAGEQNCRGAGVIATFCGRKGNVDWERLAKDLGVEKATIEQYRKKGSSYVVVQREKAGKGAL